MLESMGLDEFATVHDLMSVSDEGDDGDDGDSGDSGDAV
jgi:hypothetical protein